MKGQFICPICNGSGKVDFPYKLQIDKVEINAQIAKRLREKGYSIRQIMHALNYKSTRSITELLKKVNEADK